LDYIQKDFRNNDKWDYQVRLLDLHIATAVPVQLSQNQSPQPFIDYHFLADHLCLEKSPETILKQLIGVAKYLQRTQKIFSLEALQQKLALTIPTINLGLQALTSLGFKLQVDSQGWHILPQQESRQDPALIQQFLDAIAEEQFQQQYFSKIPFTTDQQNRNNDTIGAGQSFAELS
jgi:biotin operon repressor